MNVENIFVVIAVVSLISSVFLLMLNEQSNYLGNDINPQDVEIFDYSQKITNSSRNLEDKVSNFLGSNEGNIDPSLFDTAKLFYSGLKEIGYVLFSSIFIIPTLFSKILEIILPAGLASLVAGLVYSVIIIILLIKLVKFLIGKGD